MKKFIMMFSLVIVFITVFILLLFNYEDNVVTEEVYTVKSCYSYLSDGHTSFIVKVYSNDKNSLLGYASKSNAIIHDRSKEVSVSAVIKDAYLTTTTIYNEKTFYEYNLVVDIDINSLEIEKCYLTLTYTNKVYTFNIGTIDIKNRDENLKSLKITNLYGLSKEKDLSLAGIVITINNDSNYDWKINNISIGSNHSVLLDDENRVDVSEETVIEQYKYKDYMVSGNISILRGEGDSFLLPIESKEEYYLYNCYLLININGELYFISNFNYINSNDLVGLDKYLESGIIYDI